MRCFEKHRVHLLLLLLLLLRRRRRQQRRRLPGLLLSMQCKRLHISSHRKAHNYKPQPVQIVNARR